MKTRRVGDIAIDIAIEISLDEGYPAELMVPSFDPRIIEEHRDLLVPFCYNPATGGFRFSLHTWVVRDGGDVILIDTCCGNDKQRPNFEIGHQLDNPYLERLAAVGVRPADVTMVMCTHLHVDHCGWNTRLQNGKWVPTFPNARYVFSRAELEQWDSRTNALPEDHININVFEDSVLPVIEAGLVDLIEGDRDLNERMRLELAPGHTRGSMVMKLQSKGEHAIFAGDTIHTPVQAMRPEWSSAFCIDPGQSARTRRGIIEYCVEKNALLLPAHFPPPHGVRVRAYGDSFTILPE